MADLKTKKNDENVIKFINSVENDQKREDSMKILELMKKVTGEEPKMWGSSIIGFGDYHYIYASGREGDFFCTGFSPRKKALTLYIISGFSRFEELLKDLGKFEHGKSCLYVKNLNDINMDVLEKLIRESYHFIKNKKWP